MTCKTTKLDWLIALFLLIVQQSAFVLLADERVNTEQVVVEQTEIKSRVYVKKEETEEFQSPANTVCITISMVLLIVASIRHWKNINTVIKTNPFAILFLMTILASIAWSAYPDISARRGIGYLISIYVCIYMVSAFSIDNCMRVILYSFIISAIGSILYVIVYPNFAIMVEESVEGNWRGVFNEKNTLGHQMALGFFVQLYVLAGGGKAGWGWFWVSVFFGLVFLSKSSTALILCLVYISMFFPYVAWMKNKCLGLSVFCAYLIGIILIGIIFAVDPDTIFNVLGKESTLTGRTDIWAVLMDWVDLKPVLGWGYKATFIAGDQMTLAFWDKMRWKVPNAHNSYLQVIIELGYGGFLILLAFFISCLWRVFSCCLKGILPLGYFALLFFMGSFVSGWSESMMGTNQSMEWNMFNILAFACGLYLTEHSRRRVRLAQSPDGDLDRSELPVLGKTAVTTEP